MIVLHYETDRERETERKQRKHREMTFIVFIFSSNFYGDIKLPGSLESSIIYESDFASKRTCTRFHKLTQTCAHIRRTCAKYPVHYNLKKNETGDI